MADGGLQGFARYEVQSPALLARTPVVLPDDINRKGKVRADWDVARLYFENRLASLRSWRLTWWQHWALLAENILPRRYHWLVTPNTMNRGVQLNQGILDPTGTQALRVLAAGMQNGLTSPDRPWFKLIPGIRGFEPDDAAQAWIDEVEDRVYTVLAASNFYDSMLEMHSDLGCFGTAPVIIYEDLETIVRFYNPCAGEYYLSTGGDFRINGFFRTFTLTTTQIIGMFGLPNVGPEVQQLWQTKNSTTETEQVVAHAIEPNFPVGPDRGNKIGVVPGGYPWREVYWLWGKSVEGPLSVRGFHDKPFIAPRWATTSNDAYGRSPGMDALPDILQLQRMTARFAEAIEKQVRPPMQADVGLKNEPSSTLPGAITYVADVNKGGMKPIYEVAPDVEHMAALIEKIQNRVERWFYNDVFMMISQMEGVQPRNEMEITERRGEKLQVLGPVVTKVVGEGLTPLLARVISIMRRRDLLPPKPRSLLNVPIDVEYESINTIAQRAASVSGMERTLMMAGKMEAALPGTLDNINGDEFLRDYGGKLSFPTKDWNSRDRVARMRAAKAKMMQQQMQSKAASTVLPSAVDAAKTLSDTDVGGGQNALSLMLGTGGGGQGQ